MENKNFSEEISEFLSTIFRQAQLEMEFECHAEEEVVSIELSGPDASLIVRENGRVLYAINHILNRAFYTDQGPRRSIMVDCNQYRASRAEELRQLAQRAAETVKRSGNLLSLEPMPAGERRVVHLALAEEPGVFTESEGIGLNRRVVVLPAK